MFDFRDTRCPKPRGENPAPVGIIWLLEQLNLDASGVSEVTFSTRSSASSEVINGYTTKNIYSKNAPTSPADHLRYAIRYEPIHLGIWNRIMASVPQEWILNWLNSQPTSAYARKVWFLYEYLTNQKLDISLPQRISFVELLDSTKQYTGVPFESSRHRVRVNILGTQAFCPIVRKTESIQKGIEAEYDKVLNEIEQNTDQMVWQRSISYLYTRESRTSFEIEREDLSPKKLEKFVAVLQVAGEEQLSTEEDFVHLHAQLIDNRYSESGWRDSQTFIGETLPNFDQRYHFIHPKPEDISELMNGWFSMRQSLQEVHPVISAALTSFGYIYLHPFEDGNGRIHRFLIHQDLASKRFTKRGVVIPVSATILKELPGYEAVLEKISKQIMDRVDFTVLRDSSISVTNETTDLYRYLDLTPHVEYLFDIVKKTIQTELIQEIHFVECFDRFTTQMSEVVDMPKRRQDLLIKLLHQHGGVLSNAKRSQFSELTDTELHRIETLFQKAFLEQSESKEQADA